MKGYLPEWEELIGQSFLPENMKADYLHLLNRRIDQLR
jgi:serine/threonine-protein kinase HipA